MDEKTVKVVEKVHKPTTVKDIDDKLNCKNEKECLENNILSQQFFPDDIDKSDFDFDFFYSCKDFKDDFSDFDFLTSNIKKENVVCESYDLGLNEYEDDEGNITKSTCIDFEYKEITDEEPVETDFITLKNNLLQREFKSDFDFLGYKVRKQSENLKPSKLCLETYGLFNEVRHDNTCLDLKEDLYFDQEYVIREKTIQSNIDQKSSDDDFFSLKNFKFGKGFNDDIDNCSINSKNTDVIKKIEMASTTSTNDTTNTKHYTSEKNCSLSTSLKNQTDSRYINNYVFNISLDSLKVKYKYNLFDFTAKLVLDIYDSFTNMPNYFTYNIKSILSLILNNCLTSTIVGLKVNQPVKIVQDDIFEVKKVFDVNGIRNEYKVDTFNLRLAKIKNEKVILIKDIDVKPANIRQKIKKVANSKINILLNSLVFIITSGRFNINNFERINLNDLDPHKSYNQNYFKLKLIQILKSQSISNLLDDKESIGLFLTPRTNEDSVLYDYCIVSYELFRLIMNMSYGELFQMYFDSDLFRFRNNQCHLKEYLEIEKMYNQYAQGFNQYLFS